MIDDTAELLLVQTNFNGAKKRMVETLPCLFLVQQLTQFELKGNYDAVSSFLGYPLALKELEYQVVSEKNKPKFNPLAALSMNPNIFKQSDTLNRIKKLNDKIREQQ